MNPSKDKLFFNPIISGVLKLILFVATRNLCLDVHLFKRSRKKTPWHFQFSVCDHWHLQLILYFLCSPGNMYLLASLNLKTLFPSSRHYIHSSHAPTSQLLPNSLLWAWEWTPAFCFPIQRLLWELWHAPSKDVFSIQGFNLKGACPSVLAIQQNPCYILTFHFLTMTSRITARSPLCQRINKQETILVVNIQDRYQNPSFSCRRCGENQGKMGKKSLTPWPTWIHY